MFVEDPQVKASLKQVIDILSNAIDEAAHAIVMSDFNFVKAQCDRYNQPSGEWSMGNASSVSAAAWSSQITSKGLREWAQPHFTCQTADWSLSLIAVAVAVKLVKIVLQRKRHQQQQQQQQQQQHDYHQPPTTNHYDQHHHSQQHGNTTIEGFIWCRSEYHANGL